jgi:hypothetical protein
MEKQPESQETKAWRKHTAGRLRELQKELAKAPITLEQIGAQPALVVIAKVNTRLQSIADELDPPVPPRQSIPGSGLQ